MPETIHRGAPIAANGGGEGGVERPRPALPVRELRHPRHQSRFVLALVPSTAVLLLVAIGIVSAAGVGALALSTLGVLVVVISVWTTLQIARARLLGGAIRVSPASFPQIQAVIDEVRERLDYRGRLEVWVVDKVSGQITLTSYLGTKMIFVEGGLASDLLARDRQRQLTFLIARFVGALKAKHLRLAPLQVIIGGLGSLKFLNLFITPYERAIVYSGDQIGLACAGDLPASLGVINRLWWGRKSRRTSVREASSSRRARFGGACCLASPSSSPRIRTSRTVT